MAAISLFWYTDMVAMTSYASDLFRKSWSCFFGNSKGLYSSRLRVVSNFIERQKAGKIHARDSEDTRHETKLESRECAGVCPLSGLSPKSETTRRPVLLDQRLRRDPCPVTKAVRINVNKHNYYGWHVCPQSVK